MINPTYGVCIPGEGDVAAVTRALVTPGDTAMVTQLGEELPEREAEAEITANLLDERAVLIEERQDRQRRTSRSSVTGGKPNGMRRAPDSAPARPPKAGA